MISNFFKKINTVNALQIFHLFRFGVALLIGIVLVKSGKTIDEVSIYEYFLFISAFVSFFWINGILKTLMSLFNKKDEDKKSFLTQIAILLFLTGVGMSIVIGIIQSFIPFFPKSQFYLLILYILFSALGAMGELILVLLKKSTTLIYYGISIFGLQFLLLSFVIIQNWKIEEIIMVLVSWAFIRFSYSIYLLFQYGKLDINYKKFSLLFLFALPLLGESLMGNAMEYIDGSLVKYFFSESMFGMYRYGARELPFSLLFIGAIGTAILPLLTSDLKDGLLSMKSELTKVMKWLFPLSILLMLLSPYIFTLVYSEEYLVSAQIFNIYLLVIISRVLMPQVILMSLQKNYVLLSISLLELILNLILSLILLHYIGLLGIPIASLIAFLIVKIVMIRYLKMNFKIQLKDYIDIKLYMTYSILITISYFVSRLYS